MDLGRIRQIAGETELQAGRELEENGMIRVSEQNPAMIRYTAAGKPAVSVTLTRELDFRCDCEIFAHRGCCRHIVAAAIAAEKDHVPERMLRSCAPERRQMLTDVMLNTLPAEPNTQLEMTLTVNLRSDLPELWVGARIGQDRLYVVRDFSALFSAEDQGEPLPMGTRFVYEPSWMRFTAEDQAVLKLLRKVMQAQTARRGTGSTGLRMLEIPELFAEDLLSLLSTRSFRLMRLDGSMMLCKGAEETEIPIQFDLSSGPRGITVTGQIPGNYQPLCSNHSWGILGNAVIRVPARQRDLVRLLWTRQYEGQVLFEYPPQELNLVIGELLPWMRLRGAVRIGPALQKRLVQRELKTEIYLDRDGKSIVAGILFRYGEISINPFQPEERKVTLEKGDQLLLRNAEEEHRAVDILANAGFRVSRDRICLSGSDEVFEFVTSGLKKLQEIGEVYLSQEFRRILPRRPGLRGNIRLRGDQMELMLEADGEPVEEILELMEALSRRRRYFRLKNGQFLDLRELADWQEAATNLYEAAVRDGSAPERDVLKLRAYRAGYLSSLLENCNLPIEQDESVLEVSRMLNGGLETEMPSLAPDVSMRDYQKRGFAWMTALDRMHMGGILADDMGLGKTLQVIALLTAGREAGQTSLVVAPTSLTYNWLSEIQRFSPDLSAVVLSGTGEQRQRLIRHVLQHGDVDVMITSYPLIRRDIDLMDSYMFRFVILDEAQNIKNAGSLAAEAVKRLKGRTRFALTGTPMENGVGELWSLFDFVLPGYLPEYNAFLRRYQDGENAEDLLRRIRPFLTRRLKQEVLRELPDKHETILTAHMTPEQERVYRAALERIRPRVEQVLEKQNGFRGRSEVLSAITELRQICCHPALVMNEYRGGSGKMDLLTDLLPGMVGEGRRVLLFSQFTGMLKIIREKLHEMNFSTLYLDGDTPAGERLELTERFNRGEGEVFLISLRAGGYGLNLTGADTVIHYDPWWNPATEDQATDRAYRIGQDKKVSVVRLVTAQTIEEQVTELGTRKKALFDRLITPGESALNGLSEADIRRLFA